MREFSVLEAIERMAAVAIETRLAEHEAMKAAAELVEKEAKVEIGRYQEAAGPFAAWVPLADRTKAERVALGYTEDDPLLRDGALRDSIGHRAEGREAAVGSDSDVAVWQELGTKTIPPRSFLGGAAVRKEAEVVELIGEGVVMALVGARDRRLIR